MITKEVTMYDSWKLQTPDDGIDFNITEKLSRCEDLLSELVYDKVYYGTYLKRYENLENHLAAINRAIDKVNKIKDYYKNL